MNLELLNNGVAGEKPWLNPNVNNLAALDVKSKTIEVPGLAKLQYSQAHQTEVFNSTVETPLGSASDATGSQTVSAPQIEDGQLLITICFGLVGDGSATSTLRFYVNGVAVMTLTPLVAPVSFTTGRLYITCNLGGDYINAFGDLAFSNYTVAQQTQNIRTSITLTNPLVLGVTAQNSTTSPNLACFQFSIVTNGVN